MLIYDLETLHILKVNSAFCKKYKYTPEEIVQSGVSIKDIRPQEDIPELMDVVNNLDSNGITENNYHRHQSRLGEIFYVKISSQVFSYQGKNSRLVVVHDITEQVEAEKRSAKALEDLQHHISNSPLASVKLDKKFRIVEWSGKAESLFGLSEEKMLGKNLFLFNLLSNGQSKRIKKQFDLLVEGSKDQHQFEMKASHKDGRQFYIRVHSSMLRNEAGRLHSILNLIEDVTEQRKSKIKYQRLFENANDSILIVKDNAIVECNKQAEKLFGISREKIIGHSPVDFSPEKQPDGRSSSSGARNRIKRAKNAGKDTFEWQFKDINGNLIDTEVSFNEVKLSDGEYIQAIVRDITDKKMTQGKLRKNEELFRNLFLKSPAALVMVDEQDRIQVVNESFEKMFGYALENIRGKDIDQLVVPPGAVKNAPKMKNQSYAENDFQVEGVRLTNSGAKKNVIIAGMPVHVDGKPVAALGMYIDITDRKNSEKELKKSLEEKQVLLEEVHHRVKNNLAIISGLLQLESMNWDENTAVKSVMRQSQLRVHSMGMIHEKLYQAGNFSNIKLENYISELVHAIYETLRFDKTGINVELDVNSEDIQLNINQAIPCALIINELVTNALKHAFKDNEGGKVTVDLGERDGDIYMKVEDNGCGLPTEFKNLSGKSLGHLLLNKLVKQLQGELVVESSAEAGTQYQIVFPKVDKSGSASTGKLAVNQQI